MGWFWTKAPEWKMLGTVRCELFSNRAGKRDEWGVLYFHCFESDGGKRKFEVTAQVVNKNNHSWALEIAKSTVTYNELIYPFLHGRDISSCFMGNSPPPNPKPRKPIPKGEKPALDNVVKLSDRRVA